MGDKTGIQWTDATWNPLRGCTRVSKGCENCYAEKVAYRFSGPGQPYEGLIAIGKKGPRWNGVIKLVPEKLIDPLRWTRPRMVFVNSMSDLFHENISNEYIAAVFGVMAEAKTHTFQILTKRPKRAKEFFDWLTTKAYAESCAVDGFYPYTQYEVGICLAEAAKLTGRSKLFPKDFPIWPLPNVWLGISAENQETANKRVPLLMECPANIHWVSYEPALGPVDFSEWIDNSGYDSLLRTFTGRKATPPSLDWIVVGGESGSGSRPFDWKWAQHVVDTTSASSTAVFVKQLGSKPVLKDSGISSLKSYKGGEISEWPKGLQVREYPV